MPCARKPFIAKCLAITVFLSLFITSCATAPKPVLPVKPGNEVETLQSLVTLSVKNAAGSMGGRGYLIFKRPDRFHLAVLSPFGFTLMELFINGERITCLVPAKQAAYSGTFADLPDRNALKGWSIMRWVIENQPAENAGFVGERKQVGADGRKETLFYDARGLLLRKTSEDGDQVSYNDYRQINGVAFPASIELRNRLGETVKVTFDEPEINQPVDDSSLAPSLDGIEVLPITEFKGF